MEEARRRRPPSAALEGEAVIRPEAPLAPHAVAPLLIAGVGFAAGGGADISEGEGSAQEGKL